MNPVIERGEARVDGHLERATICLPDFAKEVVAHCGDDGFRSILGQYFESPESNASERLVKLKEKLRAASTYDFWGILMEEMCDIMGAQCGFVAKRILVDDENTAVEMPPLGEPGSCLLGVALYLNNGSDVKSMHRDYRYHAYGSPCAHMKHDKVFVIPERLLDFIPNNPNAFPWNQSEAFIGVPLFHEGKSFAHFGMIWSLEGASKRQLSWSFIEMFMYSLEDMILQRILEGRGFAKEPAAPRSMPARIIPLDAITASQSLKPYARSLSHELRTPMQGVVGMLDIMRSTVIDAMDTQTSQVAKSVFEDLRANIELVQESSKRAVEAADNVVHAYDLNMQMPETPLVTDVDTGIDESPVTPGMRQSQRPDIVIEGSGISLSPTNRKRLRSEDLDFHPGPPLKRLAAMAEGRLGRTISRSKSRPTAAGAEVDDMTCGLDRGDRGQPSCMEAPKADLGSRSSSECRRSLPASPPLTSQKSGNIFIRDFMRILVNDAIRVIHPLRQDTSREDCGELIKVTTEGPRGEVNKLSILLSTDADVPEIITAEEQHLQFAVQKVVDNAIKFTENGHVRILVKLGRNPQLIEIRISDTGCGITEESKMHLFKPHFQENASISRAKDGLGLSLFNAKAHVRKHLGGDVTLERSATDGPSKGSEFLIRLPISVLGDNSRPVTPRMGTPTPGSNPRSRQSSPQMAMASNASPPLPAPTSVPTPRRQSPTLFISPLSSQTTRRQGFNPNLAKDVPLTFLVAEDNVINRQILVGYLKKLGYHKDNIIQAYDGVEAVHQYKASLLNPPEQRINAVLMDLWMPNMDGYEATDKILKMARDMGESLAVMAVTADITNDSLERAKETGMKGFISKPYKVLDIEHLILEHFRNDSMEFEKRIYRRSILTAGLPEDGVSE